jgi:hypothetical protein
LALFGWAALPNFNLNSVAYAGDSPGMLWVLIARGTPDGRNLLGGPSAMVPIARGTPDARHVFGGMTLSNLAYFNEELMEQMINEDGQVLG